MGRYSY